MLKFVLKSSIVSLLFVQSVSAETLSLTIDLSQGSKIVPFPSNFTSGDVNLTIVNKLPNILYESNVTSKYDEVPQNWNKKTAIGSWADKFDEPIDLCEQAQSKHKKLLDEFYNETKKESKIPHILKQIEESFLDISSINRCKAPNNLTYDDHKKTTVETMGPFSVAKNVNLLFTYKREGSSNKEWNFEWKARQKGHWVTHFGFSFMKKSEERYYSKENKEEVEGQDTSYTITKQRESDGLDYMPSLMFSYYNDDWFDFQSFQLAVTAGLNFDDNKISVFLGPSIILADNLLLSFGVNIGKVNELKGKYTKEDFIIDNFIAEAELYEEVYKARLHFTFGYKFGGNSSSEHTTTLSLFKSSSEN